MSYIIDAQIEDGTPQLTVIDARSGAVRLRWCCPAGEQPAQGSVQRLFRDLFLLSCSGRLHLHPPDLGPAPAERCLDCDACTANDTGEDWRAAAQIESGGDALDAAPMQRRHTQRR